ncbi:phosphate acetyltransferase [Anaeromyxobacter sp. K]|uniref:phosphate acetyltransferase n=1 Tax=Anaeromyxobacter sp. (strain K) TaxID=447217 RepID=UPI00015F8A74|nr:phosphate acetyltransferase [Anaeromyxobacter sp. K]ACG74204.1 phosphate acetyltransferase [Anaeromyxobacter sp. K]
MAHVLLLAPAGRQVGLTTACLGLVRALDRQGVRVAFAKPIAARGEDRVSALVRLGSSLRPPDPIPRAEADALLASGDDQTLMERVVALCAGAAEGADVLVVAGMWPEPGMVHSARVNALMLKALDAELVLVGSPRGETPAELADAMAIAARGLGGFSDGEPVSCFLNRVAPRTPAARVGESRPIWLEAGEEAELPPGEIEAYRTALEAERLRPIAVVPSRGDLAAPRVKDLAEAIGARVLRAGDLEGRRIRHVALCAMAVPGSIKTFRPGTLVITPGDRSDILLAAALAVLNGVPLAGVLLTGGVEPEPHVFEMCDSALRAGLPVLAVDQGSYAAATAVAGMNLQVPPDDPARVERVMTAVADLIDPAWLRSRAATSRVRRLSPPAFRQRLVEAARAANKRIVLPEGAEPRTVAAAAIAQERGIARCVLLADADEVHEVARRQGIALPPSIEIVDPVRVAPWYVAPLVERRAAKGMTAAQAAQELGDAVMVGTMMMALDEADGLVSGALHTTAHTIRPALQIVKTVPGCNLVSSVFFMCLPEQVLVFGDCAVNPTPSPEQLADIAIQSADSAAAFGIEPRVAMLSYSTGTSGAGEEVEKVKRATELARAARPDLAIDGPLQYDAAVMPDVARQKAPRSSVAGRATVLVFPDLNTGNVTYKAVQRSANVVSIGPMLQGLARPVNDLSRGCLVEDIVFTIALTAIQAQQLAARRAR